MSSSKILHGMAQDGIVPKCFLKENRYRTPYIGLLPIAISDAVLIISNLANTEGITFICQAACCFWLVTYIMMHAAVLELTHPVTGEGMTWEAPLPADMKKLMER